MTSVTRNAYAKINLTLDVGPRRPDGYHSIRSVMQTLALHDTLTVTRTPEHPGVVLEVTGDEAGGVPADASNLVLQAAVRLQKTAAARGTLEADQSGLHILLEKRIPTQAGMGGGSSDAAAALLAVASLLDIHLSLRRLTELAATLGADVPFFLDGGTALVEGTGDEITLLPPALPFEVVVVKPPVGVSTALAYAALDAELTRETGTATERWLTGSDTFANDFERVILTAYPEVARAYSALTWTDETGESFRPLLCGSGAALFCRASDEAAARRLAARAEAHQIGKVWTTRTHEEME